ncbi:hypothetical protein Sjap_017702 [Stephania japonica]|uniref:Uncharacterized protein n=1 Tax=Stephania japonica TaxID=461633 RepID=A0AAP0NIJ2_9MAGN
MKSTYRKIPFSDVVVKTNRNAYWGRKWNLSDVVYFVVMLTLHLMCLFAPSTFNWKAFWVAAILYVVTGIFGIFLSYHRHLSHSSFKLPKLLEYFFAYCGVQALQGHPIDWVSRHRFHHKFTDTERDPHTPVDGFWFSHINWIFNTEYVIEKGVRTVAFYHATFLLNSVCHIWGRKIWNNKDNSKNNCLDFYDGIRACDRVIHGVRFI